MGRLTVAGSLFFAAALAWLHVRRRDVSPLVQGISHYAAGPGRWLMTAAFLALAASLASAGLALRQGPAAGAGPQAGAALLWIGALGLILVAAFPVRPGPAGARGGPVHALGALAFFLGAAGGAVLVSPEAGGPAAGRLAWVAAAAVALLLAAMAHLRPLFQIRGLLQRICFASIAGWLIALGLRLCEAQGGGA